MRPPRLDRGERLVGSAGRAGAVALVLENAGHELADVGLVVDDQNVGAHRLPCSFGIGRAGRQLLRTQTCVVFGIHMRTCPPRPAGLSTSSMPPPCSSRILPTIGKAQPGAPFAGRHIGLEQAAAVPRSGKPLPLSVTAMHEIIRMRRRRATTEMRALARARSSGTAADRLRGVLDDVRDRLGHQPAVERGDDRPVRQLLRERDVRMRDPHQEHAPAGPSRRDPRWPIVGFGIRAKDENSSTMRLMSSTWRTIVSVHWSNTSRSVVITLPYLRRMRSAESWIGVSGFLISWAMRRATSAQAEVRCAETRSVMSSSVMTRSRSSLRACSLVDAHVDGPLLAAARDHDLLLHQALPPAGASPRRGRATSGSTVGDRRAEQLVAPTSPSSASVDGLTMVITPLRVDADDARRNARQHRLGEPAPAIDQVARRGQPVMLVAQLGGHLVEGFAEMGEVALAAPHRHLDIEIAGRDLVGGVDQPADRRHEPVGEVQAEPDRREQHDQRDQREHRREGDLDADLLLLERLDRGRRPPRRSAGTPPPADRPPGPRRGCARYGRQLQHRAEHVALAGYRQSASSVVGLVEIFRRRRGDVRRLSWLDPLDDGAVRLQDHRRAESRGTPSGNS